MSATTAHGFRSLFTLPRLAVVFLLTLALFLFHDSFVPEQNLYKAPSRPPADDDKAAPDQAAGSEALHDGSNSNLAVAATTSTSMPHQTAEAGTSGGHTEQEAEANTWADCRTARGADKVMVVLKTGATELYEKLPTHFVTLFECTPHLMLFSDLEQSLNDVPVHDAIAGVSREFREHHDDFDIYRKMQEYQREGQDVSRLKGAKGWDLDKWKFLPMLHMAFEKATDEIEWFVYMEADTSVSWTNLLQWLRHMDPKKPFYLGAQNMIGDTMFGHGGSGFVISRRAAEMLALQRRKVGPDAYDLKWEQITSQSCCGDEVVARALLDADVPLTPAWPLIQGETVATLDWTSNHWCAPAVTWHHVSPTQVNQIWQFHNDWVDDHGWDAPYLYRDVFDHFVAHHVSVNRTHWDNHSQDVKLVSPELATDEDKDLTAMAQYEQDAVDSEQDCAAACALKDDCIQWMFMPGRCHLGNDIRLGESDDAEELHWVSGWMQDRLEQFREAMEGCKVRWEG